MRVMPGLRMVAGRGTMGWVPPRAMFASSSSSGIPPASGPPPSPSASVLWRLGLSKEQSIVKEEEGGFQRWRLIPLAMANHLCLGSIFAWSLFNQPLTRLQGVIVPSAPDWALSDVSITFSLVMGGFVWGALLSRPLERWGPRASCLLGALSLGSGFALAASAAALHSLPLLLAGGAVWGLANGLAYVPPVAMLLQWYPTRRGFASGACLVGFGGGALLAAPLFTALLKHFSRAPLWLGPLDSPGLVNQAGRLFLDGQEVVAAATKDLKGWPGLSDGLYAVGSGDTGAAATLAVLGLGYASVMALCSLGYRLPASSSSSGAPQPLEADPQLVSAAMRMPQFGLLMAGFGFSILGSYGILAAGQTMLTEAFGATLPTVVTAAFAASFVGAMSASNLAGRLLWSNASDALARRHENPFWGRRTAFSLMWGMGAPLYGAVLWSIHNNAAAPSVLSLSVFCGAVCGIIANFGGAAATWPAVSADLWGSRLVGVLQARQLAVVLPAAFIGPRLVTMLRERGIAAALKDLTSQVPDDIFYKAFGASKDSLDLLIASKTVTINRLLELIGPGAVDPSPFLYNDVLLICAVLQGVAFGCIRLVKPPKTFQR